MTGLLPIPAVPVKFIYDPHGVVNKLTRLVEAAANGSFVAGVVVGNYGFGKTHTALYIADVIRRDYGKSIVIYVNTPGSSFMRIYRSLIDAVLGDLDLVNRLVDDLDTPLKTVFSLILGEDGDSKEYARSWLYGESVPQSFRVRMGLGYRVNEEVALGLMIKLINAVAKFRLVYIILDELEDLSTIVNVKKLTYLNMIRAFIDSAPGRTLFLALSTPAGWDEVVNTHPALARRLSTYIFYLRPYNRDETWEFIRRYIEWRGLRLEITPQVASVIYDLTEGNPGEIVRMLLVLHAEYGGGTPTLDDVKNILSKYV